MSSPDSVSRLNTALEGRYRIERELGEGGMATVYLADDLRHERKVALKVLKPELAAVVGAERFLGEIKTTANLQHPHILPLHDSGEADGFLFYVMPYIEGETLRDRLDREKQLPIDEAVRIATDVAEALHSAHERGVIHRDVKPANILLSRGRPLVADFGIALAVSAAGGGRLTETGLSMGTPFYMSPEQASADREPSPASDVYSLGCVLYEMLVGDPPYTASSAQAVLAMILTEEARAPTQARASIPPNVDAAIRKSLEKLPADRFTNAQDFAKALADPRFRHGAIGTAGPSDAGGRWKRISVATTALAAGFALALGWSLLQREATPGAVARFESPFRGGQEPTGAFELTRDGSALVYVGRGAADGQSQLQSQLWIRSWGDLEARPVPGTEGVRANRDGGQLGVSPDGREVAFAAGNPGPLRVVPLSGGPSRTLAASAYNAAWSHDDWIYFTSGEDLVVHRARSTGGEAEIVTERLEGEQFHVLATTVPDGETLLFQVFRAGDGSDAEIWSVDLATRERTLITQGNSPRYVESGQLLFGTADGRLMAAPFDVARSELTGAATPVIEGLVNEALRGHVSYAVAEDGTLVYLAGETGSGSFEFLWVTRSGEAVPVVAGETFVPSPGGNDGWRLSPDGSRIAFTRSVDGNDDVWIAALPDGPVSRLTFDDGMDLLPQWHPDGETVTYRNGPLGEGYLWSKRADGTGDAELVLDGFNVAKGVWSPDGVWLVARRAGIAGDESARDILAIRPGLDSAAVPLVATPGFWEQAPAISRDGRWLAYSSNETGRHEIFVRPFPDVEAGKWQVSSEGGIQPVWAHNGQELFFANPLTRELMVAEFTTTSTAFQRGRLATMFEIPGAFYFSGTGNNDFYDVAMDDERFLMAREFGSEEASTSLVLVQNFFEELRARVPN